MPFGLKNDGATYQKLINQMSGKFIEVKFEAYIDNMVIKSRKYGDCIEDIEEIFEVFQKFRMKLNPLKCTFGVASGQF